MNTSGLRNVHIEIYGHLEWPADNIQYWLSNSFSVTYAGRSTAWMMGGNDIAMLGHGKALFFGNGQIWFDQNRNQGNQNGRPISLTLWYANNVWIDGITWRQSQFWHTFIAHSTNITMTNIDTNSTSATQWSTVNTDGTDTWNSKDIVLKNWTVTCGDVSFSDTPPPPPPFPPFPPDLPFSFNSRAPAKPTTFQDCISVKGNSSNVYVSNFTCYESGCAVIGSMGNPTYTPDYVDNILYENGVCIHSSNAAWIKTYPGTGHVKNVTFRNIEFQDVNIAPKDGGEIKFLCSNIRNQATCGLECTGSCPGNWPQQLDGNR